MKFFNQKDKNLTVDSLWRAKDYQEVLARKSFRF